MSISSLYSNLTPTLIVDPRNSRRLDPRFTFSRASSATYVNRQKVITTAKSNEPFVEWDPATGSCLGLRLWGAVTNLRIQSEDFVNVASGGAWSFLGSDTATQNQTLSPANTLTADLITEGTSSGGGHGMGQPHSFTSGVSYTSSVFAKEYTGAKRYVSFLFYPAAFGSFNFAIADVATGQFYSVSSGVTVGSQLYANGFRRVWATCNATATTTSEVHIRITSSTTDPYGNQLGNSANGMYLWGAQINPGAIAPYVPTGAATVSTSATTLSLTGTEFARIWNTGGLGIYAEVIAAQASNGSNQFIARASDGSYNNAMALNVTGSGFLQSAIIANGTLYVTSSSSALVSGNVIKTATRINTNDLSLAHVNSTFTNNVVTLPTSLNRLDIGADHLGLNAMVGMYLRRLCVYPRGLTNSQMLQLIRG